MQDLVTSPARAVPALAAVDRRYLVGVLGTLTMLAPMSTTMALPAGGSIMADLHVGPATVATTLSAFFLGFGLGQLVWGPLGDRYGRRGPILAGLALYMLASLAAAVAGDGTSLIVCRFLQAVGGCAPPVLAQAIVRDRFERREAAGVLSLMMLVTNLAPLLAPNLGGLILLRFSWRAIFVVLAVFGVISTAGVLTLPESHPRERRVILPWRRLALGYGAFFRSPRYLVYLATTGCFGAAFFGWLAGSQIIYVDYYRVSPQLFSAILGGGVIATMSFNVLNRSLVRRIDPDRLLRLGLVLASTAAGAALLLALHPEGRLWPLTAALCFFTGSVGLVTGNTTAGALADFPATAGAAAALLGATRAGMGAVGGLLVGAFADGTPLPVAAVIAAMSLIALAINVVLLSPRAA